MIFELKLWLKNWLRYTLNQKGDIFFQHPLGMGEEVLASIVEATGLDSEQVEALKKGFDGFDKVRSRILN